MMDKQSEDRGTGCSLSDQHILSDLRKFTKIVLKFKTQVLPGYSTPWVGLYFRTICLDLRKSHKISRQMLGLLMTKYVDLTKNNLYPCLRLKNL